MAMANKSKLNIFGSWLPKSKLQYPVERAGHCTIVIEDTLYLWGGDQKKLPNVHDNEAKRALTTVIDVFHLHTGKWNSMETQGSPPLGVSGYACSSVSNKIYYFGGDCGHDNCYHNCLNELNIEVLTWTEISSTSPELVGPMRKAACGMVYMSYDKDDLLFVFGGYGLFPSAPQCGSSYEVDLMNGLFRTNEQHLYNLTTEQWSSPQRIGQCPLPCNTFTMTAVSGQRAIIVGGCATDGIINDIFVTSLIKKDTMSWNKIAVTHGNIVSRAGPFGRRSHSACTIFILHQPYIVVLGGEDKSNAHIKDCCILNVTDYTWQEVSLPVTVAERSFHSASAFLIGPCCVWLVITGGLVGDLVSGGDIAVIVELVYTANNEMKWSTNVISDSLQNYENVLVNCLKKGRAQYAEEMFSLSSQMSKEVVHVPEEDNMDISSQNERVTEIDLQEPLSAQMLQDLQKKIEGLNREKKALQDLVARLQHNQQDSLNEDYSWVVRKEEVELTDEIVGKGAWGVVKIANFRGIKVAAKCLHNIVLSEYNMQIFTREMEISAQIRHPNILQFIGATREGIILSELMPTNLYKELENHPLAYPEILKIALDVCAALNYLHNQTPHPILHRDISSPNVLLETSSDKIWKAKLSDYGSANFAHKVTIISVCPGSPAYSAPEASFTKQHSPAMDVYSFGILLAEMILCQHPSLTSSAQIENIQWPSLKLLIQDCLIFEPRSRPTVTEAFSQIEQLYKEQQMTT